jgi:hypothetical protein
MSTIRDYFDALIPVGATGYLHTAFGREPYLDKHGKYTHKQWIPRVFKWPEESGDAIKFIEEMAPLGDVYVCETLMRSRKRAKGDAVGYQSVHSDVDTGHLDYIEVEELGGFVIASGTPGHGHAHIPLADEVTEAQHEALCEGLRDHLGGDNKIRASDVLRPPGTYNHKPTVNGGGRWDVQLVGSYPAVKVKSHELAAKLGVDLCTTNGSSADTSEQVNEQSVPDAANDPEPVDMKAYPWIQESLDIVTDTGNGGRSVDISRVVKDCFDAGLTLPQTRWIVNQRDDLVTKLAELQHDDVRRNWNKTSKDWPHPQYRTKSIIDAIVADWQAQAKIDEDALWDEYPELTACRDYARSVRVGPLAMLGAALTVASATIPPHVVLPAGVGDYASVNLYTNLAGESGAIKSQAVAAARAWLQTVSPPDPVKPGSGQGVAKCFAYVKKTKNGPEQVGKRWTAVAMIPEVDTLTAAGSMTGSSLWAELRSAWSDERVGHDYADVTKSVVLQPRRYRLCMIVGVQPLRAGPMFDDVDAGTPQRFVWFPVDDLGAPEQRLAPQPPLQLPRWGEKWADPTDGIIAFFNDVDQELAKNLDKPCDRSTLIVLKIPPEAAEAIDAVARGKLRGNPGVDPLDGHKLLCQLKVAASLMRLCNRDEITSKDWELAGIIMAISDRTRGQVKDKLDAEHNRRNLDAAKASGARKIVETQMAAKAEADDIARVADVIVAALTAAGGVLTGGKVSQAVASRDRHLIPKVLDYLEIDEQAEIEEIKYHGRTGTRVTLLKQQTK